MTHLRVALTGFPNCGKSSLFNKLTGLERKTSNYSGITVDQATGLVSKDTETLFTLIDLPGIYQLSPGSLDEAVTVHELIEGEINTLCVLVDFQRLESSLALVLSLKEHFSGNIFVLINKDDKGELSSNLLQQISEHLGVNVYACSVLSSHTEDLKNIFLKHLSNSTLQLREKIAVSSFALLKESKGFIVKNHDEIILANQKNNIESRALLGDFQTAQNKNKLTQKIDALLLHQVFGGIFFVLIFYGIFHLLYQGAEPVMSFIEDSMMNLANVISPFIPAGILRDIFTDGIMAGLSGVVVFLPQIMLLFFLLSILEESGYIARASLVADRIMGIFGLSGQAFLPYLSSFACSIPGIMATRTISDKKERLATLMTIPLITCSARLPVYILLIATFVPAKKVGGFFSLQALAFFGLYFLGSISALIMAKIFRLTYFKGKAQHFVIDLPKYNIPNFGRALQFAWKKGSSFVLKAGKIILFFSLIIWALSYFPRSNQENKSVQLEQSYLGMMGKAIEPVISPLGMDWKMGIGLLVAQGARELFVSTMATIYALGDADENSPTLRARLQNERSPKTGELIYTPAVVCSLLLFFVFSLQCISTLAVVRSETGSYKIAGFMFFYMGLLAYGSSFLAYQLLK